MENFEEKACLCALNRIFGFEPKTGAALISREGSAAGVFHMDGKNLERFYSSYPKYRGMLCNEAVDNAAKELLKLEDQGISFCGMTESDYPHLLQECPDAPIGIYIKSGTPTRKLWKPHSVSIVGTRDLSSYGKEWCHRIVKGLAGTTEKPVIVSGLALGTDIEAHRAAVESGLPTIAVMATGADSVYPYRHSRFAAQLAETPGCALITDYPPGTPPLAVHFLRRNRIIAGLGASTVLIESKIRGGGLMTCRLAFSYDRDVHVLPGRIDDVRSQGCNELIRRKSAEPITSVRQLIRSLGMHPAAPANLCRTTESIPADCQVILETICSEREITIETIAARMGIRYAEAARAVSLLELQGFIETDLLQRCSINPKNM